MSLDPQDFKYLSQLLQERSGLVLTEDKYYLLEFRLLPLLRRLKLDTISALVAQLKLNSIQDTLVEITEAIPPNHPATPH